MVKKKSIHFAGSGKKMLRFGTEHGIGPFQKKLKRSKEPFTGVFRDPMQTESEPRESKGKAALALEHQGGGVETGLTFHISTSSLPKNEEDCKI